MSRIITYTDRNSAYGDSHVDFALGYMHEMVGSNQSMGQNLPVKVLVLDQHGNVAVGIVLERLHSQVAPWKLKENGKPWKYVYRVKWLVKQEGYSNKKIAGDQFTKKEDKEQAINDLLGVKQEV